MKQLMVVTAGLSQPSTTREVADEIAAAVRSAVGGRGENLEVTTIEVREYATELTQLMLTGMPSRRLDQVKRDVSAADALVAVSPVFQGSYSAVSYTHLTLPTKA